MSDLWGDEGFLRSSLWPMNFTRNKLCNELDMAKSSNLGSGIHDVRCPHLLLKTVGVRALMRMMKVCEIVVWLLLDILQ